MYIRKLLLVTAIFKIELKKLMNSNTASNAKIITVLHLRTRALIVY